jgi:hypothetical protein
MPDLPGSCSCRAIRYILSMDDLSSARTSLCHCLSCRKAFGTNYGITTKVPLSGFTYTQGTPNSWQQDNGVTREFCSKCGTFLTEYGEEAADKWRYVMWGTFDDPDKVPPKGEFFCKFRASWMPEIPGTRSIRDFPAVEQGTNTWSRCFPQGRN